MKHFKALIDSITNRAQTVLDRISGIFNHWKERFSGKSGIKQSTSDDAISFDDMMDTRNEFAENALWSFKQYQADCAEHFKHLHQAFDEQFKTGENHFNTFTTQLAEQTPRQIKDEQGKVVTIDAFASNFTAHHNHLCRLLEQATTQANAQQQKLEGHIDEMVVSKK